jgi:hypothetical protein
MGTIQTLSLALLVLSFSAYGQGGGERKLLSYRVDAQQRGNPAQAAKLSGLLVLYFDRDARESSNFDALVGVTPSSGYGDWAERNVVTWTPGINSCDLKIKTVSLAYKDGTVLTRTATFSLNRKNGKFEGDFVAVYTDDAGHTVGQEAGHATAALDTVDVLH